MTAPYGCGSTRRALPLRYYAALSDDETAALLLHLSSCGSCASEWESLRQALDAAEPAIVFPRERDVDWDGFARATVARARTAAMSGIDGSRSDAPPAWPGRPFLALVPAAARWAALAAAAAVAALVLYGWPPREAGTARVHPPPASGPSAESVRESAAVIESRLARRGAARYLTDSRVLLLNLVQAPARCRRADGEFDITFEKEKSRELLRRKNLHEGDLDSLRDRRLADLVGQLEAVLIQVASLEDCASARQLHELREQVEKRQILLRIDLMTREMQGRSHVV
ncbi:MAG: hypothetical protein HYS34_04935 [Acidobacteria bacterium]|nr:hypothetical protein [Acidobacteriota bacterium]